MEFWISWFHEQTDGEQIRQVAVTAEALGFTGVALSDHIALPREQAARHPIMQQPYATDLPQVDPFTITAAMGAVTESLRFMSYALVSGSREPFSIARQAGSLAGLTGGRFALGITPGWLTDEMELLGHDPRTRGKRLDEALDVIDGLWRNDLFSYAGAHYRFRDVAVCPRPSSPPKILIGGNSQKSWERARGRDGWIGMTVSEQEIAAVIDTVRADDDSKEIYMIPDQALTEAYLARLQSLGVTGLVNMVWFPGDPSAATTEAKCLAMEEFAGQWL